MYAYQAQHADELSFQEGDTLYVLEKGDDGWWKAKVNNKTGLIPSNYIETGTETIDNPLHEAAKRGNLPFIEECLSNLVSVNGLDKSGSTALHWAASAGHPDCARRLLAVRNVEINVQNKLGDTPMHNASWKGHADIVDMLLLKGANKAIKNNEGQTAYDLAVRFPEVGRLFQTDNAADDDEYGDEEDSD